MNRRSGITLLAILLVIGRVAPVTAQTSTPAPALDVLLGETRQGQTVFLTDQAGTTVKGRIVRISPTSIELMVKGASREWRASDLAWITERRRFAIRGSVIGLAAGTGLAVLLVVLDGACENGYRDCARQDLEAGLLLSGFFGGIGAGIGAIAGAATRVDRVLYAAAPVRSPPLAIAPLAGSHVIGLRARLRF